MIATNGIADGTNGITLRECPFCEGEAAEQFGFNINPNVKGRIICSCGVQVRQGKFDTEDDVRAIWNTRAERKPTDAVREFAERYERRIAELEAQLEEAPDCSECSWPFFSNLDRKEADEKIASARDETAAVKAEKERAEVMLASFRRRCDKLETLVRDMDFCIGIGMCCDQCPIRPCRMGERISKMGIDRRKP